MRKINTIEKEIKNDEVKREETETSLNRDIKDLK